MKSQEKAKFHIELDPEYEEEIFNRFTELVEKAIEQTVERASIQNEFLTQGQVMETIGIGHKKMNELYEKGLKFIKLGNKKLIDINDLREILNKLKF